MPYFDITTFLILGIAQPAITIGKTQSETIPIAKNQLPSEPVIFVVNGTNQINQYSKQKPAVDK
ncbi:hypothetical protein [Paraglaciecola arctica]|uniref:hypothetical protein n=1 Tax=Paraglaciecola arctica TaxID=1128911 RepID=UPI001C06FBD2|nr:hypothetical protein [Paraglaciecola arctica]MBU3003374.1 hypothetical protein [Paraglaciecola arctica]